MKAPPFESIPQVRAKTLKSLVLTFYRSRKEMLVRGDVQPEKLPPFARKYLQWYYGMDDEQVREALMHGDPWFFVAWRGRLAQIDLAMIEAGANVGERWALAKNQHLCALYEEIARKRLGALGGSLPDGNTENNAQVPNPAWQSG